MIGVEHSQISNEEEKRNQRQEDGEKHSTQKEIEEEAIEREGKTPQDVGCHRREEQGKEDRRDDDDDAVKEIFADVRLYPCAFKVVELQRCRECPRTKEDLPVGLERGVEQPNHR